MNGKGSGRRPTQVDEATFARNWEQVFGGSERRGSVRQSVRQILEETYDELCFMDDFDDCILGVCDRFGQDPIVAYDYQKVLQKLQAQGMTEEEAVEFFEFNQLGAWVGDLPPCFVTVHA